MISLARNHVSHFKYDAKYDGELRPSLNSRDLITSAARIKRSLRPITDDVEEMSSRNQHVSVLPLVHENSVRQITFHRM